MKKKIATILASVISSCIFLFAVFIIIIGTIAYRNHQMINIFGYSYSVVPTPSMVDAGINPNDFILSKRIDFEDVKIGDIIVYYSEKNEIFIVHQVIDGNALDGFVVKGTNNPVRDDELVTKDNFQSKVIKTIKLGFVGKIANDYRYVIFIFISLVFIVIIANECINLTKVKLEIDAKKKEEELNAVKEKLRKEIMEELKNSNNSKN